MDDKSDLDKKYFIDKYVYNCPFCNRNNVRYSIERIFEFNWSKENMCYGLLTKCSSCDNVSMHLSYESLIEIFGSRYYFDDSISDIDHKIFYSVPTSFFVIDNRIKKILRELITEAEGCLKMNFLTGASSCVRKAIYELLIVEQIGGDHYEDKIKSLKTKYPSLDESLFDILLSIQEMTSDKIHEQSWEKWDSDNIKLIIETLKTIFFEIYVLPMIKKDRNNKIKKMREELALKQKATKK